MTKSSLLATLAAAVMMTALAACGGDEPATGEGNASATPQPELPAGHKRIKQLRREMSNGTTQVLNATYSGNRLTRVTVTTTGWTTTSETLTIDYRACRMTYKPAMGTYYYDFTVNSLGHITSIVNTSTALQETKAYTYNADGELQKCQTTTTDFATYAWFDGNLTRQETNTIEVQRQFGYIYGSDDNMIINKGSIEVAVNVQSPFGTLITCMLRSEGLLGRVSRSLPLTMSTKTSYTAQDEVSRTGRFRYNLDAEGFITSLTGYDSVNDLSYTTTITYAN